MKVLLMGAAGHVGTIIRPTLEAEHECWYYDRRPIPDAGERAYVADVNDNEAITKAVKGMDAVVYLAMGIKPGTFKDCGDIDTAFDVNVRGIYRLLLIALPLGVRRFIYISTLSIYDHLSRRGNVVDESVAPTAIDPYGMSKRLGENVCAAMGPHYPDATILVLRLFLPQSDADWAHRHQLHKHSARGATGPNDTRRLFQAALRCDKPGVHIVQATGDVTDKYFPNTRIREVLGWSPRGE